MPDDRIAMNARSIAVTVTALFALALPAGCKPKPKAVTELQRKEAEHIVAEADFAVTMKDWTRAEGLLAKAVQVNPNDGVYWMSLGSVRMRLGNKNGAKDAYEGALKAWQIEAEAPEAREAAPWLQQVQALALLGRVSDARALLEKAIQRLPDNRELRSFAESKQLERMIADPAFKQIAL